MTIATCQAVLDEPDFGGRQARLVFALLVTERHRAVPREELAGALWGERLPQSWEAALRMVVSKVRSVVVGRAGLPAPDALTNAFGCYQLHLPPEAVVDLELAASAVIAAEDALADGDVDEARAQALAAHTIAKRPFLPGEPSEWAERTRAKLLGVLLRALETLAHAHIRGGDAAAALEAAEEAVALDPFRESAHRSLMAAHAECGNRAAGLKAYERCRRLLAEELGVAPSAETEAAYIALLGAEPTEKCRAPGGSISGEEVDSPVGLPEIVLAAAVGDLVGREPELLSLERVWPRVCDGRRHVVLVEGEAGMGKTALAATAARELQAGGATVLYGRCDKDVLIPYQPFVEAVDRYVRCCPAVRLRDEVGPGGADLARLVVDLLRRLPELTLPPPAEPETERHRLFGAVTAFLNAMTNGAPVVMLLDDFQWAAPGTVVLLRHVMRALESARLLILVCYREDELGSETTLADFLGDVIREGSAHRIELAGLDEKAVAELVRRATPGFEHVEGDVARAIQELTAGNPLFVTEVLRHVLDRDWPLQADAVSLLGAGLVDVPRTVHEVIGRRYVRISETARQVLDLAAVVGHQFELAVLDRASRLQEEQLISSLEETARARLTQEVPGTHGMYSFTSALSREVVYARLSGARRAYLHRRVAEAIEHSHRSASDSRYAELARHYEIGGEMEKAVRYAVEAGNHAYGRLAYEGAACHYGRALRLGYDLPEEQQARCRTLMALAAAHRKAGNVGSAREAYLEATNIARDMRDPEALAGCALGLSGGGRGVSAWIADEVRLSLLEEALAVLGRDDSELRARVLAELAKAMYFSLESERRDALASEAVEVARRLGTPTVVAGALSATRVIRWGPGNTELRLAYGDEVLALSEQSGDPELVVRARLARLGDLIEVGDRESVDREIDVVLNLAADLRQPYYLWRAMSWDAHRALMDGLTGEAEQRSHAALAIWQGGVHPDAVHCSRVQQASRRIMLGSAAEAADLLRSVAESHPMIPSFRCLLAFYLAQADRCAEARAEFERFATDGFVSPPVDAHWLVGIAALAETCALIDDRARAGVLYELLRPFADRMLVLDVFGGGGGFWGSAAHQLGLLAATSGHVEDAERHLRAALDANARFGARYCVARTEEALAALPCTPRSPQRRAGHADRA